MNLAGKYSKRVYLIGAGVSKEIGAPLINDFLEELLSRVPKSRTQRLRKFLRKWGKKGNIEKVLSEIDKHIWEGENLASHNVSLLRKIRTEIVDGICDTLTTLQYGFLRTHYDYKRYEDPYYYWRRDFEAVARVKKNLPEKSDHREWELFRERAKLREGRSLDKLRYLYISEIAHLFNCSHTDPHALYLLSAALAGGQSRFREWVCALWPLYLYLGYPELKIKPKRWNEDVKRECIDQFLSVLNAPSVKDSKSVGEYWRKELVELLGSWKDKKQIKQHYVEECALEIRKTMYSVAMTNTEWLRRQAEYLLRGSQSKINPYLLLAALLREFDTVITPNYDVFIENAITTLYPYPGIDYGIRELIAITPWGEEGQPFYDYDALLGAKPFTVLKLHGSINWLRCPFCYGMYCTFDMPAKTSAIRYLLRDLTRFTWEEYRNYPCCHLFNASKVETPIVPPTLKKSMQVGSWAKIWAEARKEIAIASELIFIGDAFSRSDYNIQRLILDALDLRHSGKADWYAKQSSREIAEGHGVDAEKNTRQKRAGDQAKNQRHVVPSKTALIIRVINPSSKAQERYKEFFSKIENIKFEPVKCTASEYLKREFLDTHPRDLI